MAARRSTRSDRSCPIDGCRRLPICPRRAATRSHGCSRAPPRIWCRLPPAARPRATTTPAAAAMPRRHPAPAGPCCRWRRPAAQEASPSCRAGRCRRRASRRRASVRAHPSRPPFRRKSVAGHTEPATGRWPEAARLQNPSSVSCKSWFDFDQPGSWPGTSSGQNELPRVERSAIEPKLLADSDEHLEIVRLGLVLEGWEARRVEADIFLLDLLGWLRIGLDESEALVDRGPEVLDGLWILLRPVAGRHPGTDQHVGIDLAEILRGDIADVGGDDAGPERLDGRDQIHRADLQQIG